MSSVMARLREETRAEHEATERTDLARAMAAGTMRRPEYKAQLAGYRQIHAALEDALARSVSRGEASAEVAAVVALAGRKTQVLDADLAALGPPGLDSAELRAAIAHVVERLRAATLPELLGALYVLEGSALGALVLLPRLRESLGFRDDGEDALGYYRGHGAETRMRWKDFSAAMDRALGDPASQDAAVASARRMFQSLGAMFAAISATEVTPSPSG